VALRRPRTRSAFALLLTLGLVAAGVSWSAVAAKTKRVSVSSAEREGNLASYDPVISAGRRFVAFESDASNLVSGDGNGVTDVFVRDRRTGRTRPVSVSSGERQGNGPSFNPVISADGRFVAFQSDASNLVRGDGNGVTDIFIRDRRAGRTAKLSVSSTEVAGNGASLNPAISANGRFIAFSSAASNLVTADANATIDIFVRDRRTGTTRRVSVSSAEAEGNGGSGDAGISANGRFVSFASSASNLVENDTNADSDVFVRDRRTGNTRRLSVSTAEAEANGGSVDSALSADGRFVAFESSASNLVPSDANAASDTFVRDRWTGTTRRVSVSSAETEANGASIDPSVSAGARFIAYESVASNLVRGDGNSVADVFVRDRRTGRTRRISVSSAGREGNAASLISDFAISADGRFVVFDSAASNLVASDRNRTSDVFVRGRLRWPAR
jgi:Tol biopolymer transport system component